MKTNEDESNLFIPSCFDITNFLDFLRESRKRSDDQLAFRLNEIETSFKNRKEKLIECEKLWNKILQTQDFREKLIQKCIMETEKTISQIEQDKNQVNNKLWVQKKNLSFLKSSLDIENILKLKAIDIFNSKCQGFKFSSTTPNK